jgi:PAS domain S-box-containing protein
VDGTGDFFNRHYLDYVGLSLEQMRGLLWRQVIHPEDLEVASQAWERFKSSGVGGEVEARIRRHDGVYRWFLFRASPLRDESGSVVKWYGVNTDIEERKRVEDEARRREYNLAAGERVSLTGSYTWEVSTDKITPSAQLLRIHEFDDPAEVTAEAMRNRIHPDDHPILEATMAEVQSGRGNPEYEIRLLMPDGRVKYVRAFAQVIYDQQGQVVCIGAVQDVTRRRLAEDALDKLRSDVAHRTRVMSLGTLAASIAHELNQPLAGLMTSAGTCVRMLSNASPNLPGALETARRMIRDSNRAAEVISRLRALFSGKVVRVPQVDLNEVASEVLTLLASDLHRNRVLVQTHLSQDLPSITADRIQLQQVILNLVRNAAEAMSNVDDRQRQAVIETARDGHEHVRLSVRDAGVGFEAENAERLFEAFYTTKDNGMGIGLSLSRSIIESHQGRMWAERRDEGGAIFSFSIPIDSSENPPAN